MYTSILSDRRKTVVGRNKKVIRVKEEGVYSERN